jgi:glycosyltransferase involved in cell wall biosynthesis
MDSLKVLLVTPGTSSDDTADVRRLTVLKNGLESCGVQTHIISLGDYFLSKPQILQPINIPRLLKMATNYDVVHSAGFAAYVMALAKMLKKFTLICDIQGSFEEDRFLRRNAFDFRAYYSQFIYSIGITPMLKHADYFIPCSRLLAGELVRRGIYKNRICVIRNGIDTEVFRPSIERRTTNVFTITYAGGFQKYQGLENLLGAAHRLKDVNVKFKIIGFRSNDFALKEEIREAFGSRVELVDFLSERKQLVSHLQDSDVFIIPRGRNPATVSAFPTKFAEYLSVGKPVIVTDVDETAEFVKIYDCGFVCRPDVDSISNAIVEASETSSARRNQMGENGRRLAETEFDQKVLGKAYYQFLLRILKERSN